MTFSGKPWKTRNAKFLQQRDNMPPGIYNK